MTPSETRTGATPEEVAAPAARPLRRGRRSRKARCRRWNSWHALVSHSLVALMLKIPVEANRDSLDESVSHVIVNVRDRVRAVAAAVTPKRVSPGSCLRFRRDPNYSCRSV